MRFVMALVFCAAAWAMAAGAVRAGDDGATATLEQPAGQVLRDLPERG